MLLDYKSMLAKRYVLRYPPERLVVKPLLALFDPSPNANDVRTPSSRDEILGDDDDEF